VDLDQGKLLAVSAPPRRRNWLSVALAVVCVALVPLVARGRPSDAMVGIPAAEIDEPAPPAGAGGYAPTAASRVGAGGSSGKLADKSDGANGGAPSRAIPPGPPGPAVHAPVPLAPIAPVYPDAAARAGVGGDVALILSIDQDGQVTAVEVEAGLQAGLTEAAVTAARAAHFRPATDAEGRPAPIRLRWLLHFAVPARVAPTLPGTANGAGGASPSDADRATGPLPGRTETFAIGADATLSIRVRERGTGKDLPTATVFLEDFGELRHVDPRAHTERSLGAGAVAVIVRAPGHHQEEFIERLHPGERVERTYFVEKDRLNEYESVVHARPPRAETGVITLEAEEIHNIPGTFGDPFRTTMLLPGVGSVLSGVGYPVIRGESPGQTGTFIDDVRVPLLYHLGFGPAVVHPLFLESLDFHPGNFPAEFGRFSGALIHAHTTAAATEAQTMLSVDLFKLSAFHARPFTVAGHEGAVAIAARYGTFAFLARAIDPRSVLEYWDYQLRGDLKIGGGDLRVLVFGAQDTTGTRAGTDESGRPERESLLRIGFHRLAASYHATWAGTQVVAGLELGPDATTSTGDETNTPVTLQELVARPQLALTRSLGSKVKVRLGADLLVQKWKVQVFQSDFTDIFGQNTFPKLGLTPGAFVQADVQPSERWMVSPGVRFDYYDYVLDTTTIHQTSVDPRLAARVKVRPGLFAKAGFGLYSSPPRFLLPWPGLSGFGLDRGLNRSYQSTVGAELTLPWDATLDGQVYFNWIPRLTEFSFGRYMTGNNGFEQTFASTYPGRAYGLELIARRRLGNRLFGWLTYTYSRAERNFPGQGWQPADFDEPHLANAVVSYALGRSWTVSTVFHYNSGRPYTIGAAPVTNGTDDGTMPTSRGPSNGRFPGFWRLDLRIEKREAFDTWYLDFYVDWLNISLQREAVSWDDALMRPNTVLLTIPTIGLQAVF
jgi:TonB family protein